MTAQIEGVVSTDVDDTVISVTFSHTVPVMTDGILIVNATFNNRGFEVVTGVTFDGDALTFIGQVTEDDDTRVEQWRLLAPAAKTADVVITLDQVLGTDQGICSAAMNFSGVDQTTPIGNIATASDSGSSTATVDISSSVGELVLDGAGTEVDGGPLVVGAGQTQHYNLSAGVTSREEHSGGSTEPGAATVTMSWTLDASDRWGTIAMELLSAAAATPPTVDAGGPYNGDVDTAIALNATVTPGTDPTPVLLWTIFSGPGGGVFSNDAIEDPTFTPDTVGSYVLQLSADPSDGPAVLDTANLESDAVPPTVDAGGPYNGDSGQATALNATVTPGSDPTPALLWTIDSGGAGTFLPSATIEDPTFTPTFPTVGPYTLRLTATPSDGPAVFDTAAFESDPVAPIVDAGGPYSGTVDTPIALNATVTPGTDPAPTLLWTIDSGPGTGDFLPSATVEDPTFTPDLTGTYTLRLTVTPSDVAPVFDTASLDSQGFVPVAAQTVVGIKTDNIGRPICAFLGIGDPLPVGAVLLAGDALAFDGTLLVAIDDGAAPRTVVNGLPHTSNGIRIVVEAPGDVNLNGWRLRSEPLAQCINDGAPGVPFYNKGFAIDGTGLMFVVDGGPAPTPPPAEFFPPALANLQLWFDVQTNDVNFGPLSTINGVISLDGQNVREMNSRGTGAVAMIQNGGSPPIMRDNGSGPNGTRFLEHIGRVPLISNPDPSYTGGLTGYAFYVVCRANAIPLSAPNRDAYKWVPTLLWGNNTGNAWQVGFGSTVRVTLKTMILNQWVYLYGTIDNATDAYVAKASGVAQISGTYNTYNNPFSGADVQLGESSIDVVEAASYDRELTLLELTALETYFNDKFGL